MNKYIKNYILSVVNTVLMLLFPIITFPYVARILGPSKLGIINFTQAYGYYFTHIASFGINSYAIREVSKVRENKQQVDKICNEIFNLNLFFSAVSTFLYFCGVFFVQNFKENLLIFTIYSMVIFTNFLSIDWLLQSFDDYYFSTVRNLIIRIISLIAVFLLIKNENDFILYMLLSCFSEMGSKFSTLIYSRNNYAKLRLGKHFLNFRAHIKAMFTLFTFRLVNGISANLDKLMIGFMITYSSVGIYTAGVKFILIMQGIVETVGIVLFPKINISAQKSIDEYKNNLKINYDAILLLGVPMAVGMYLISGRLILLFAGKDYVDAIHVSRIMSVLIAFGAVGDLLGSKVLLIFRKDKWLLMCSIVTAISNVVFNFVLIPIWGINGAALASVISYVITNMFRYFYARKIIKINLLSMSLFKYIAFTIPFIAVYIAFADKIDASNSWMFSFVVFCICMYAIELLISKDKLMKMLIQKTGIWNG